MKVLVVLKSADIFWHLTKVERETDKGLTSYSPKDTMGIELQNTQFLQGQQGKQSFDWWTLGAKVSDAVLYDRLHQVRYSCPVSIVSENSDILNSTTVRSSLLILNPMQGFATSEFAPTSTLSSNQYIGWLINQLCHSHVWQLSI